MRPPRGRVAYCDFDPSRDISGAYLTAQNIAHGLNPNGVEIKAAQLSKYSVSTVMNGMAQVGLFTEYPYQVHRQWIGSLASLRRKKGLHLIGFPAQTYSQFCQPSGDYNLMSVPDPFAKDYPSAEILNVLSTPILIISVNPKLACEAPQSARDRPVCECRPRKDTAGRRLH